MIRRFKSDFPNELEAIRERQAKPRRVELLVVPGQFHDDASNLRSLSRYLAENKNIDASDKIKWRQALSGISRRLDAMGIASEPKRGRRANTRRRAIGLYYLLRKRQAELLRCPKPGTVAKQETAKAWREKEHYVADSLTQFRQEATSDFRTYELHAQFSFGSDWELKQGDWVEYMCAGLLNEYANPRDADRRKAVNSADT